MVGDEDRLRPRPDSQLGVRGVENALEHERELGLGANPVNVLPGRRETPVVHRVALEGHGLTRKSICPVLAITGPHHRGIDGSANRLAADGLGTVQKFEGTAAIFEEVGGMPERLGGRPGDLLDRPVGDGADDQDRAPASPRPGASVSRSAWGWASP